MEHVVETCSVVFRRVLMVLQIFRKLSLKTSSAQHCKNCAIPADPCHVGIRGGSGDYETATGSFGAQPKSMRND